MSEPNFQAAVNAYQTGRRADAEAICKRILKKNPNQSDAIMMLGILAHISGRSDEAVNLMRRAIAITPQAAPYHCNLAMVLLHMNRYSESEESSRTAIRLWPQSVEAHSNLGNALAFMGRYEEALDSFREALRLRPDYIEVHFNMAVAYQRLWRWEESIASAKQAIALRPMYVDAYATLAVALHFLGRFDESAEASHAALELQPNRPDSLNNLASSLRDMGRMDEAIAAYARAADLMNDPVPASNRVYTLSFHPDYNATAILEAAREWDRRFAQPLKPLIRPHTNSRDPNRRLRIGYVSPDFREHVVAWNLLPLLKHHDHQAVEVFCYADIPRVDDMTKSIRDSVDQWRDLPPDDNTAAEMIRADGIDILVDLTLYMARNRLLIFARKPAPIQATYLGYCSTTGLETMDYRLSDPQLDPPDTDLSVYSERTMRLPRSYWCYQPGRPVTVDVAPLPMLAAGHVTFGCMNHFSKMNDRVLETWAEILGRVADSRLILFVPPGQARQRVLGVLEKGGVISDRVELLDRQLWPQYLQTFGRIDIALDPFPYGGGITSCDGLWMGVPVVTLSGQTAVGRAGRSILTNIGLPDLVAQSREQYIEIAVKLAGDVPRLTDLRRTMRERMKNSPLMDAPQFARDFEAVLRDMWREYCR